MSKFLIFKTKYWTFKRRNKTTWHNSQTTPLIHLLTFEKFIVWWISILFVFVICVEKCRVFLSRHFFAFSLCAFFTTQQCDSACHKYDLVNAKRISYLRHSFFSACEMSWIISTFLSSKSLNVISKPFGLR